MKKPKVSKKIIEELKQERFTDQARYYLLGATTLDGDYTEAKLLPKTSGCNYDPGTSGSIISKIASDLREKGCVRFCYLYLPSSKQVNDCTQHEAKWVIQEIRVLEEYCHIKEIASLYTKLRFNPEGEYF